MTDADILDRAFDRAHEAFIAVGPDGVITAWNPAAVGLYGYTASEAIGRSFDLLYFPPERGTFEAALSPQGRSPGNREDRRRVQRQRHKSGEELWVDLRLAPLGGDGPGGFLVCAADATGRRRAEEGLEASREALAASRAELRAVARRLVGAQEEARRRIARELHDDLAQRLGALALEIQTARRALGAGEPRDRELDGVVEGMAELAQDLHRLSHDLHPSALERFGLAEALGNHCAELGERYALAVRLSTRDAGGPLPPELALGLYRIAQEALANAVRHAAASSVHVTLAVHRGEARLAVADDGAGFDPGAARRAGGLGLVSLAERAELLGGRCRIVSAPGAGTEIEAVVPLPAPAAETDAAAEPATEGDGQPERFVGPYRLLESIGEGTTATVYLAEEPPPLGRKVAIKLHRGPAAGRRETLRFKAEQQALARLRHPAIAQIYEARTTEAGDPYIVMEYLPGLPITEHCDRYGLDLRRRLELFAGVCRGVQHAHQRGVLHRDLKPSNVLVTEESGSPVPKVVDFGIAKGLDRPLAEGTVWTAEALVGTPAYLAPEVVTGGEVDTRADVYALGVLLHQLLVGTVPVEPGEGGVAAFLEAIRRGEVPAPSRRLEGMEAVVAAEIARRRGFRDPAALGRRLAGDLDQVVLRALAPEPAARYPSSAALAEEVGRYLRGEPVEAGPPGPVHRLRKFVRRYRGAVAAAALVILALAGGLVATAFQVRRAEREAERAGREAAAAEQAAAFLTELFRASDPARTRGGDATARELLDRGAERIESELAGQPRIQARLMDTIGEIYTELGLYEPARPLLEGALEIRREVAGEEHLETAESLAHLAKLAMRSEGDAEALYRQALAIREAALGPDHPQVAQVLNDLGVVHAMRGGFDEAEKLLERAQAIRETALGADSLELAKTLNNLAGIYMLQERLAEAEPLARRGLEIRERALPPDHPDLAANLGILGSLYERQGRFAEAVEVDRRALEVCEQVFGPEHYRVALAQGNLGSALRELGELDAAEAAFRRSLEIRRKAVGPDHPALAYALIGLARIHRDRGDLEEAAASYRRALELHQQALAPDHPELLGALRESAAVLRQLGRDAEAAELEARADAAES